MAGRDTRGSQVLALLALVLTLAACGDVSTGATSVLTPSAAPSTASIMAAPAMTAAPSLFASLPQSRTAEGYYVLGKSDAPGLIEFYSDFL